MSPVRLFAPAPLGSSQAAAQPVPGLSFEQTETFRSEIARIEHLPVLQPQISFSLKRLPSAFRDWLAIRFL